MRKRNKGEVVYKKRFIWIDAECHALLWSKKVRQIEHGDAKPLVLVPETTCSLRPKSGPMAWEITGAGFSIELKIMDQIVKPIEIEAFSPEVWIATINALRKVRAKVEFLPFSSYSCSDLDFSFLLPVSLIGGECKDFFVYVRNECSFINRMCICDLPCPDSTFCGL